MADDVPFYAPHQPPRPPRQPEPGELPFEFVMRPGHPPFLAKADLRGNPGLRAPRGVLIPLLRQIQLGCWPALRAMRCRGYTPEQCRETLSVARHYARVH